MTFCSGRFYRVAVAMMALVMPVHSAFAAEDVKLPTTRTSKVRVVLAGDSTVTDDAGWGGVFAKCWKADFEVINMSRGGRSSSSFIKEGRWKTTLDLKPDYVLIQFGHNDQPGHGDRETDPATTYRQYMTQYIDEAIAAGIKPVLVTSISRREFGKDGRIHSKLLPWVDAVKAIAAERKVPLIDLHERSIEVYESLGQEGCKIISPMKKEPVGAMDGTHLNEAGGMLFGQIMADALRRTVPETYKFYSGFNKPAATTQATTVPATAPATVPSSAPTTAPAVSIGQVTTRPASVPATMPTPKGAKTITVAQDGTGDFTNVQQAIAAVENNNADRTTIYIKPGVYIGQVMIEKAKQNVSLIGEYSGTCILSYALNVYDPVPPGSDPRHKGIGVVAQAEGFQAENLTFRNSSGDHGQALALRTMGDRTIIKNCRLLGWQDTLRADAKRQYFKDCYIEGRVDFIYAGATAVFDQCIIKSKDGGFVTAASTPQEAPFGYVFLNCKLVSDDNVPAFLGRPWRPYAAVAFINCEMGSHIRPEGWNNWGKEDNEKTSRYAEFGSTGPGANPEARVKWAKQLTAEEAAKYSVANVLGGADGWDPTE